MMAWRVACTSLSGLNFQAYTAVHVDLHRIRDRDTVKRHVETGG